MLLRFIHVAAPKEYRLFLLLCECNTTYPFCGQRAFEVSRFVFSLTDGAAGNTLNRCLLGYMAKFSPKYVSKSRISWYVVVQ